MVPPRRGMMRDVSVRIARVRNGKRLVIPSLLLLHLMTLNSSASAQLPNCCADRWSMKGIFSSATGGVSTGLGTATLAWGSPLSNSATFSPVSHTGPSFPTSGVGVRLTYTNGSSAVGTAVDAGLFQLLGGGCDLVPGIQGCLIKYFDTQLFTTNFSVISTVNTSDPTASADGFFIPLLEMGAWVLEGGTAVFEIDFQRRSPLELTNIRLVEGNGFVSLGDAPIPLIPIVLDVKPEDEDSPINPKSRGRLPVAVVSSYAFSSLDLDPSTIEFGPAGVGPVLYSETDTNGDGLPDLLLHFETQQTGIVCGDLLVLLKGRTYYGEDVRGVDSIRTTGCTRK
jgi:hypothetical protein